MIDHASEMAAFVRVVDAKGFSAAAPALGLTPSAVSKLVTRLETRLGVRLLQRTTRAINLTAEGQLFYAAARRIVGEIEQLESAISDQRGTPHGPLRVSTSLAFSTHRLAPLIGEFLARHPAVQLELIPTDRVVDMVEEGIDVGVRISPLEDSSLVAQPLASIRRVVVASPGYLRAHGVPRHPRELLQANCVRVHPSAPVNFRDKGRTLAIAARGNLAFNHIAPAIEACAADMGFGIFFSYQVAPFVAQGRLRLVLEAFEPDPRPVSLVYPHARLLPARTRAFIEWMKKEFAGLRFF